MKQGYKLVTDGTDNHLILWDLRPLKLTGSKMETICDLCHITLNKNAVHGDRSALSPGGVRIGTPACTTRGFTEDDFRQVAEFLHRSARLCLQIQKDAGKKLADFVPAVEKSEEVAALRADVHAFANRFAMPGVGF